MVNPIYIVIGLLVFLIILVIVIASKLKYCYNPYSMANRKQQYKNNEKELKKLRKQYYKKFMEQQQVSSNGGVQRPTTRCGYPIYVTRSQ